MARDKSLVYQGLSKTQKAFHNDASFIKFVGGPPGSAKSTSCLWDCVFRCMRQPPNYKGVREHRVAVIRATYPRLKTTTVKTINAWLGVDFGNLKGNSPITGEYTIPMPDGTLCELELILLSVNNEGPEALKSLEVSSAWVQEASEVDEIILDTLVERVGRFPAVKDGAHCAEPGIVCDFNLVGKEHWLYRRAVTDPDVRTVQLPDGRGGLTEYNMTKRYFEQPPAAFCENFDEVEDKGARPQYRLNPEADNLANLPPGYYANQLISDPTPDQWAKMKAHLFMMWTTQSRGRLVYERSFSHKEHVAPQALEPVMGMPVLVGVDTSGLHPCAVFCQIVSGQVRVLDEAFGDNVPFDDFINDMLKPVLAMRYPASDVLCVCDPANPRDTRIGETPVQVLNKSGVRAVAARTNTFSVRREAVSKLLGRRQGLWLSPRCSGLIEGFTSTYVFKQVRGTSSTLPIYSAQPDKSADSSHYHDALQYAALHVIGEDKRNAGLPSLPESSKIRRKIIA